MFKNLKVICVSTANSFAKNVGAKYPGKEQEVSLCCLLGTPIGLCIRFHQPSFQKKKC